MFKKTWRVSLSIGLRTAMIRWLVYLLRIFKVFHGLMNKPVFLTQCHENIQGSEVQPRSFLTPHHTHFFISFKLRLHYYLKGNHIINKLEDAWPPELVWTRGYILSFNYSPGNLFWHVFCCQLKCPECWQNPNGFLSTLYADKQRKCNALGFHFRDNIFIDWIWTAAYSRVKLTYLLTSILAYLLHGGSPSWEANRFAASQEIPRIS